MDDKSIKSGGGVNFAYLSRCDLEDGKAYRGGILILNELGVPQEFRCTSPIRPNPVQRTLYGKSLEPHLLVELMGRPLLRQVAEKYDLVLCNEPTFLNLRDYTEKPVLYLRRQGEQITRKDKNDVIFESALVSSPVGTFDTIIIEAFHTHKDDVNENTSLVEDAANRFDPLEPFERIMKALHRVHEEKVLDSQ